MNIMLISSEFPPFSLGGVSVHANQLSKKICSENSKNKIIVITLMNDSKKPDLDIEYANNETVVRLNIFGKITDVNDEEGQFVKQNLIIKKGINYLNKKGMISDINLITLHGNFLADAALFVKNLLKVPLVYHAHSTYSFDVLKKNGDISLSLIASFEQQLCNNSKYIIAVSSFLKSLIIKYFNIDSKKIFIIGKGIDIEAYDNVTIEKCWKDYRILFVGRISREKGIEVLLMALRLLLRIPSFKATLYIIGSAINQNYLDEIKLIINQLSLNRQIVFLGSKKQSEIIKEFKSCDLIVVPSHNETFGRVAIEAMAAKIPVIVSDVGGLGPLVEDSITGFKFSDGNYIDLMNKILFAYNNPSVCQNIVENAYNKVCNLYTFENIYYNTINIYMKATKE